ncbi:serine protease [Citrobacter freundii]|uniref:S1 family peptidase n=1 Tax=Citrobacter TaxID=544 RepID=UPI001B38E335|nr:MULTISPECIES: serine protease [Citrobacter]MBP8542972.1 trypsin-like serine protease [Citrobacter sp. On2M]MBW5273719.1 trypsin-like serine protease [Citrobacter sp. On28M]MDF5764997.1 serine protease [Citrobacter freundii]
MMLDSEVRLATCRIVCGKDTGTGWLISQDKVLTARHCVENALFNQAPVSLAFRQSDTQVELKATVLDEDENTDVCLLLLDAPQDLTPLRLSETRPLPGSPFYAYGWPQSKLGIGHRVEGTIAQILAEPLLGMDIEIAIEQNAVLPRYEGLSGAALITGGNCTGILRVSIENTVGVISVAEMAAFLRRNNLLPAPVTPTESYENTSVAQRVEFRHSFERIITLKRGGYLFLKGAHGIGKSTFCAKFTPKDPTIEHFGTYSFNTGRDGVNAVQQAQPETFVNWLSMQVSLFLTREPGRLIKGDYSVLINETGQLLTRLGEEYARRNKTGVLFIDGLDEVDKYDEALLNRFTALFPLQLSEGLVVIFSAPGYTRYSAQLGVRVSPADCCTLPALTQASAREYCRQSLKEVPSHGMIRVICDLAQGHPLYLRYLIDLANAGKAEEELAQLPLIDGRIRNYYEMLWVSLQNNPLVVNLLAIIVRLRWGISHAQLTEMLSPEELSVLVSTLERISHLLMTPGETTIYHASFADFLAEKTALREADIQQRLSAYCESHPDTRYGLLNLMYHSLRCDPTRQVWAISRCDQHWADRCVTEGVNPALLLGDVRETLNAALASGSLTDTVRLLLLSHRLSFRYNTLFAQSALLTARALIRIGHPQEALQHVIRFGRLSLPVPQALQVAFDLICADNDSDALALLSLADDWAEEQLAEVKTGLSYPEFLQLYDMRMNIYFLKGLAGDRRAEEDLKQFQLYWMNVIEQVCEDEETARGLRGQMCASFFAGMLFFHGRYISLAKLSENFKGPLQGVTQSFVITFMYYHFLCEEFQVSIDSELLNQLFKDLTTLSCLEHESPVYVDPRTLDAMISSGAPAQMIRNFQGDTSVPLQPVRFIGDDNVSANDVSFLEVMAKHKIQAFCDPSYVCPVPVALTATGWIVGMEELCRMVAWCEGAAGRFHLEGNEAALGSVWTVIEKQVLNSLTFPLSDRVDWHDAYALPEAIVPQLYERLALLISSVFPSRLDVFLAFIEQHFPLQFGLYSEGFRTTLLKILTHLSLAVVDGGIQDRLYDLTFCWYEFVLGNLQNRHELVPELLHLVSLFVRLGAGENARQAYQQVLAFSMGPDWYKEDQFGLMITALRAMSKEGTIPQGLLARIACLLDMAGGEMTFQRYVRYARRDFAAALWQRGNFTQAAAYFMCQTYGTTAQLYAESTQGDIDRVSLLKGTRFPGGALDEQDVILNMVRFAVPMCDWALCWALLETYHFGDARHLDNYADAYAQMMISMQDSQDAMAMISQRLTLILEAELMPENRQLFLKSLRSALPAALRDKTDFLNVYLSDNDSSSAQQSEPPVNVVETQHAPPDVFVRASLALDEAERQLRRRNTSQAKNKAINALEMLQLEGWSVWSDLSEERSRAGAILLKSTDSVSEIVTLSRTLISAAQHTESWRIADKLIEWLSPAADETVQTELAEFSLSHIEILTGMPVAAIERYNFLNRKEDQHPSYALTRLLLHAVDHPVWMRSEKAAGMLLWLLQHYPHYVSDVGPLAFSMVSLNHPDVLCGVLDKLSQDDPESLWTLLSAHLDVAEAKKTCCHAGRIATLRQIAGRAASMGNASAAEAVALLHNGEKCQPLQEKTAPQSAECPEWAGVIAFQWRQLADAGLVDGNLSERAFAVLSEQCHPFGWETVQELEELLATGMSGSTAWNGRWEAKIRFAVLVALLPVMDDEQCLQAEAIFRIYNPEPTNTFRLPHFSSPGKQWFNQLIRRDANISPVIGSHLYLDFYERRNINGTFVLLRLTAYFYREGQDSPGLSGRFPATALATSVPAGEFDTCVNVQATPAYFGSFTPAIPSPGLVTLTRAAEHNFKRASWRNGRDAESQGGSPLEEGCYLSIKRDALRLPPGIRIVWVFEFNNEPIAAYEYRWAH